MVKTRSLSRLGLVRYQVATAQTDGQTDRIPVVNTRSHQYLPVQLSRKNVLHTVIDKNFHQGRVCRNTTELQEITNLGYFCDLSLFAVDLPLSAVFKQSARDSSYWRYKVYTHNR